MAAVAATDSVKPASRASPGSAVRSTQTEAASAGTAARGRPAASAISVIAPIAAARTTLGPGRASTTKPASPRPATSTCTPGRTPRRRSGHRMPVSTIATFAPETAVRWESPALRKSAVRSGSIARVSPTTRPGSSPAGRSSSVRAAEAVRPSRRTPAARWIGPGPPSTEGGPRAERTATTSLPVRGSETPARTWTVWPGARSCQPAAGAKSSTAASSRCVVLPSTRAETVASAITRGPAAPDTTRGSPCRVRVTSTPRPASAAARSGETSRAAPRTDATPLVTASPASTASSSPPTAPRTRLLVTAAVPPASTAIRHRAGGASRGASSVVSHTVAATGASRRSVHAHRDRGLRCTTECPVTRSPARSAARRWPARYRGRRRAGRPRRTGPAGRGSR